MTRRRFQKYTMTINPGLLTVGGVNYLNDDLWAAFQNFYLFCFNNKSLMEYYDRELPDELVRISYQYFEEIKAHKSSDTSTNIDIGAMADQYFENFTPIWNLSDKRNKNLWYVVLKMVQDWEKKNSYEIHKGTLFYFWATTDLLHGDYDEGFILMHKALEEDRRKVVGSMIPDTPAHDFVSMNEKPGAYLQPLTNNVADFVKRRLDIYRNNHNKKLNYQSLRSKFLDSSEQKFEDIKFFFSYTVLKLMRLRLIHSERNLADERMSALIFANVVSDLLIIIDQMYCIALESQYNKSEIHFSDHIEKLAVKFGWSQNNNYLEQIKSSKLNNKNFQVIIESLLDRSYKNGHDKTLNPLEADIVLSYRLRNFSAHSVSSQKILWEKFTEVLQAVINSFFLAIEEL